MEKESFLEKFVYKIIEKHIAGKTMSSALEIARGVNSNGIGATLTFLTDTPKDRTKANYVVTTYMQLARQMTRFGIRGCIHISLDQIGGAISDKMAEENVKRINKVCITYGIKCWYELKNADSYKIIFKNLGTEVLIAFDDIDNAVKFVKNRKLI